MLGILTLDTAFPRIPGDVGCPATFAFPVRIRTVTGATVDNIVHRPRETMLPAFIAAGRQLADDGCICIATTCGFLARWQADLTAALPIPVLTSALLQLPLIARTLPRGQRAGIVTYSTADLTAEVLAAVGVDPATPVAGVAPDGYFAQAIRFGAATLDAAQMAADTIAAAHALTARDHSVAAVVLECANMPPYRRAVAAAIGRPVFDAAQLIEWFYAGLAGYARADLW
jgi:hypothetical protein